MAAVWDGGDLTVEMHGNPLYYCVESAAFEIVPSGDVMALGKPLIMCKYRALMAT